MIKLEIFCEIVIVFLYIFAPKVRGIKDCLDLGVSQQEDFDIDKFKGTWYVLQTASTVGACMTFEIDQKETGSRSEYSLNVISLFFNSGRFLRVFFKKSAVVRKVAYRNDLFEVQMPFDINPYTFVIPFTDYDNYALLIACKSGLMSTPSQMPIIMHRIREGTPLDLDKVHRFLDDYDIPKSALTEINQYYCANNTGLFQIDITLQWYVATIQQIKALLNLLGDAPQISKNSLYYFKNVLALSNTFTNDPLGSVNQAVEAVFIPIMGTLREYYPSSMYSKLKYYIQATPFVENLKYTFSFTWFWEKINLNPVTQTIGNIKENNPISWIIGKISVYTPSSILSWDIGSLTSSFGQIKSFGPVATLLNMLGGSSSPNPDNTKESEQVTLSLNTIPSLDSITSPPVFKNGEEADPIDIIRSAIDELGTIINAINPSTNDMTTPTILDEVTETTSILPLLEAIEKISPSLQNVTLPPILEKVKDSRVVNKVADMIHFVAPNVHNFLDENDLPRSGLTKISQSHCANNTGLYQIDIKATWFVTTVRSIKALLRILRKAKRIAQTSIYHVKRIWNISRTIYDDPWGYIDQSLNKILIPIENCLLSIYSRITILIRMIIDKINQIQDTIANSALWEKIKVSLSNAIDKIQNNYQVPSIMGRMDENTYDSPPIMDRIKNATHIDTLIDAIKNAIPNLNISSVTPSSVAALLNLFKNIGPVNNLKYTKESIPVTANVNVTSNLDSVTSSSILDKIKKSGTVTAILNKVPRIFKSRKKSYPVAALSAAIKKIKPIMDTVDKMDLDDKSSSVINDTEASTPVIELLDKNKDANPITPIPVLDDIKGSTPESTLNQVIGHIKNATHIDTIFSSLTSSFVQIKESGPIAAVLDFFRSSTPTNILSDTKKSNVTKDGTTKSSPEEVLLAAINQINPIIEAIDEINLASDAVTDISSIAYVEESTPLMEILDTNKDRNLEDVTTAFILDDRKGSTRKSTSIRATKKVTSSLGNKAKDSLPVAAMKDIFKRFIG